MKARAFAWEALSNICLQHTYSNLYLRQHLSAVEKKDRALSTQIIYGTLQNARYCRYQWEDMVKRLPPQEISILLDMSVYQLLFMDRLPAYAILDDAVTLCKRKHARMAGMVNALLRKVNARGLKAPQGTELQKLALTTSHPDWLVAMWQAQYGEESCMRICQANMEVRHQVARVNTLAVDKATLLREPCFHEGKLAQDALWYDGESLMTTSWYQEGKLAIQDEASQLVAELVDPRPDSKVLDVCAAPGTKATHMAQRMQNKGRIVCGDLHAHRVKLIEEGAARLGITILEPRVMDATVLAGIDEAFDHVLCDVPCSGYGVLARKSDIKYHMRSEDMDTLIPLQQAIIRCAAQKVRPKGTLVYSTCTLNKKENEKQVEQFLREHPDFILETQRTIFPYEYDSDGFYMARLQRITS